MEQEKKIRVAITHGDTNGIGYELILKVFEEPTILELFTPIIYGSPKVAAYYAKTLGMEVPFVVINDASEAQTGRLNILNCFGEEETKVDLGEATQVSATAAKVAIDRAIDDYGQGLFDVLVTAPVNRSTIEGFNGHTDYLRRRLECKEKGISLLLNEDIRVALVTNNLAIKDIPESITKQKIVEKAQLFQQALKRDLRINNPRIAVMSLNPRCGEDGALGDEEQEIITPAIDELKDSGIQAFGPYAADNFFGRGDYLRFDGVLAMYHDQGITPFKTIAPYNGVRLTSGLPIVRTAPIQGPNLSVAGRNQSEPDSLRQAIYLAIDVWRNRQEYDAPLQNPLPKLYHEKRDESEKVRFRTPERAAERPGEAKKD
jgi:4-hydroxythreonine-4-phosphate dehydrogenase